MWKRQEIARSSGIIPNSVSSRLAELETLGLIKSMGKGKWIVNPLILTEKATKYQVWGDKTTRNILWKFQNITLISICPYPIGVPEPVEDRVFGDLSISISFGGQRNKIDVRMRCPLGLDVTGFELAVAYVENELTTRGFENLVFDCTLEFLNDYKGLRLDGVSGITITDFRTGILEKIYEKPEIDSVRHERRGNMTLDEMLTFVRGGFLESDYNRRLASVERELIKLSKTQMLINGEFLKIRVILEDFIKGAVYSKGGVVA